MLLCVCLCASALHKLALIKIINYCRYKLLPCKVFWVQTFCYLALSLACSFSSNVFMCMCVPVQCTTCRCCVRCELNASRWHRFMMPNAGVHEVNTFPIESDKRCVNFLYWSHKKRKECETRQREKRGSGWLCVCVCVGLREKGARKACTHSDTHQAKLNESEWSYEWMSKYVVQLWFEFEHMLCRFFPTHKTVEYHSLYEYVAVRVCVCKSPLVEVIDYLHTMHTLFIYSMLIWKLFVLTWILILSLLSAVLFISKIRAKRCGAVAQFYHSLACFLVYMPTCLLLAVYLWERESETHSHSQRERTSESMCIIRLSVDFRMGEKAIKIPQSLFSFARSVSVCVCAPQWKQYSLGGWRTKYRDDLWVFRFLQFLTCCYYQPHSRCLFVENGCFYYWSRELPNCIHPCTFVCMRCDAMLVCSQQRRKIKHLIQ